MGKALYSRLFEVLVDLGHCQAFAGIALPNAASVTLHESVGFEPAGRLSPRLLQARRLARRRLVAARVAGYRRAAAAEAVSDALSGS